MIEKIKDPEILLKAFFKFGVTPEFAENSKDADALKGLSVFSFQMLQ